MIHAGRAPCMGRSTHGHVMDRDADAAHVAHLAHVAHVAHVLSTGVRGDPAESVLGQVYGGPGA